MLSQLSSTFCMRESIDSDVALVASLTVSEVFSARLGSSAISEVLMPGDTIAMTAINTKRRRAADSHFCINFMCLWS